MKIRMAGRRAVGSPKSSIEPAIFCHNRYLLQLFLLSSGHWPYITRGWVY